MSVRSPIERGLEMRDVYQEVTDRIAAQLEAGNPPWVRPWTAKPDASELASIGLPYNAVSGKSYSGINILLLWSAPYASTAWLTYKQAEEAGGHVRKGEHATEIVFASSFVPKSEREEVEAAKRRGEVYVPRRIHYLKFYRVFNVEQCDDLPDRLTGNVPQMSEPEKIAAAEELVDATGAHVQIGARRGNGSDAFYAPGIDVIHMPPRRAFKNPVNYYSTLFHELAHWTGHESRLDRESSFDRRSKKYAIEEIVAELGSAYLCASVQIEPTCRHDAYIRTWLTALKEDKKFIFKAATAASKAADFVLSAVEDEDDTAAEAAA